MFFFSHIIFGSFIINLQANFKISSLSVNYLRTKPMRASKESTYNISTPGHERNGRQVVGSYNLTSE